MLLYGDARTDSAAIGRLGEACAALRLRADGWRIVARRARTRFGELDLIATRGAELAVVEVKAARRPRTSPDGRRPLERIVPGQLERLETAARGLARRLGFRGARVVLAAVVLEPDAAPMAPRGPDSPVGLPPPVSAEPGVPAARGRERRPAGALAPLLPRPAVELHSWVPGEARRAGRAQEARRRFTPWGDSVEG